MKVSSIQQLSYTNISNKKQPQTTSVSQKNYVPSFCGAKELSNYLDAALYMWQIDKLKKETEQFPNDIKYRTQLLKNAGLNPLNQHKIRAIIGPQEIKSIMLRFDGNPDVYSVGENDKNIINRSIRANLHVHTTASDGTMTVKELLDSAAEYADNVKAEFPIEKEPFTIAITDHDTTEGAKEAIKIISEKPLKYKNLRVILGAEITTFENLTPKFFDAPKDTHILVYGIDPNEKIFGNFIDITKRKKQNIEEQMIVSANKIYKKHFGTDNFFSVSGAKEQYNSLDKNILGIFNGMDKYIETKSIVENIILKDEEQIQLLKEHNIPVRTKDFMTKLAEFSYTKNGNNVVKKPIKTLPEFIATMASVGESDKYDKIMDSITNKINEGINSPKYEKYLQDIKTAISEYKVTPDSKYHYMPDYNILNDNLSGQPNVIVGIAHPIDTVKKIDSENDKFNVLSDLYKKFKTSFKEKAVFSEVYYQSYKTGRKEFNESLKTQDFLKALSKTLGMLRTGSYDSHGLSVFRRL